MAHVDSAASILTRAVSLDKSNRFTEAMICYQEGLQLLVDSVKSMETGAKKEALKQKIEEYMRRAEFIKRHIEKEKDLGKYHEQISIENNSTGHSYNSVVGRFLDSEMTTVRVEDPYIRNYNQCRNFLQFCELLVKKCPNLKQINLVTGSDARNVDDQKSWLNSLKHSLENDHKIKLLIEYSATLHDREITLGNGWVIKIGRGLDYFKPADSKFAIGAIDYDLRHCHETTVDIFHSKNIKHSAG
ncbi:hypothetical protein RUM43_006403 [Polyplax serrata]|uniref:MIT domain-containing protein n=1 Tax=Polyplax serrata TaxID=468196 RepID=A0AAN8PEW9_POLSC